MSHPYTPGFGYLQNLGLPKWLVDPETDEELGMRYPGTYGNYTSTPEDPSGMGGAPVEAPRPSAGWAARLFGGADPMQSGLLDPTQARGLGRQALLQTGLSLLANSGPSPYRRGLGELLATGIQSGQQAYQQGADQALGQQSILQQMQGRAQLRAINQRYAGRNDPESMRGLLNELITLGTPEALQSARSLSEYLKSQQAPDTPRGQVITTTGPDGRPMQMVIDPTRIGQTFPAPPPQRTEAATSLEQQRNFQRENQLSDDFERKTRTWADVHQLTQGAIQRVDQAIGVNGQPADGAAQIELLYAFIRALDPESVVREGEVALARSASSPYAQAQQLADKWAQGENVVIPTSLIRQMGNLLKQRSEGVRRRYDSARRSFQSRARSWGVNPDVFLPLDSGDTAPTASPSVDPNAGLLGGSDSTYVPPPRRR